MDVVLLDQDQSLVNDPSPVRPRQRDVLAAEVPQFHDLRQKRLQTGGRGVSQLIPYRPPRIAARTDRGIYRFNRDVPQHCSLPPGRSTAVNADRSMVDIREGLGKWRLRGR